MYSTPGRRPPAKAAAKAKGQIRVQENLKTKAAKLLSTSELATMPKLQKMKDEVVSTTILEEDEAQASTTVRLSSFKSESSV